MIRNHLLLLVEDNPDDVELTLLAFGRSDVDSEVVVARDGEEALHYLFATGPYTGRDVTVMPDVILLDLKLPKLDGLEVLRQLRADERTQTVPVVILTSSREEEDIARSYQLGANSYVRKPVDFDEFHEAARRLSIYWLMLNEAPPMPGAA